ncbi:MAG: DUF1223 domain-containing protein [Pseudomonadota bacterium]
MPKFLAIAAAACLFALGSANAGERAVVVELYTSQGCSSCPPADALLGQIADRDNVIALALHVDYWDYIGWKDDFADPSHTKRQRAYARAAGSRMIYTPQMVIDGQTHVIGSKPMDLSDALNKHGARPDPVAIDLVRSGDRVRVTARAEGSVPRGMEIQLFTYEEEASRAIRRGENAGRTLTYHHIVTEWQTLGQWSGDGAYEAVLNVSAGTPLAVVVQGPNTGPVLGAAQLR